MKRASCLAVGEKHSLALQCWCQTPCMPLAVLPQPQSDAMPDSLSEAGSLLSPRADAASVASHDTSVDESAGGARLGWQEPSRYWQDIELAVADSRDEQAHSSR